jgi:hypothetical protein
MSTPINDAISESRPDEMEDHVLVGWTMVAEWIGPNGVRTLSRYSGAPSAGTLPPWQVNGYLHEALFGSWKDQDRS